MEQTPLFDCIDLQGDPTIKENNKLEPIFDAGALLRGLDVDPSLVGQVASVAELSRPLGTLVLARKPHDEERLLFEGRGAYHEHIPVSTTAATVYVKGTGNEEAFDQPPGVFTGFPSHPEGLFFDSLNLARHPRILGTETARWALMEAINAGHVFAHIAKREGWTCIDEAVAAGVTIPLNVMHLKELSAYMGNLLAHHRSGPIHTFDEEGLAWKGNDQLATVSMIVPGHVRMVGGITDDVALVVERLTNPENTRVAARTLRTLLDAGFCYSSSSAHGQNLYTEGLMAQADNSDLVSLGDYRGCKVLWDYNSVGREVYREISAYDQRMALLFYQFEQARLLTPMPLPVVSSEMRTTWEQTLAVGEAFWSELLRDVAQPGAIKQMMRYLPAMRTEFNVAAARLLIDAHDPAAWEAEADKKTAILQHYEAEYGVLTEYRAKLEANLSEEDTTPYGLAMLPALGKLRSLPVMDFLRTGDEQFLRQDPILSKAITALDAIEGVQDVDIRDELLGEFGVNFATRTINGLDSRPDMVTAFEGRQYDRLTELLAAGRLRDAQLFLEIIAATSTGPIAGCVSVERDGEVNRHKYTRLALEAGADYEDLHSKACLEVAVERLKYNAYTAGTSFMDMARSLAEGQSGEPPAGLTGLGEAAGLPSPRGVLYNVLMSLPITPAERQVIAEVSERYNELVRQQPEPGADAQRIIAHVDELGAIMAPYAARYPELTLAHCSYASGRLAAIDPQRAQAYSDEGMKYYAEHFSERARYSLVEPYEWDNYDWMDAPSNQARLRRRYTALGLPYIVAHYNKRPGHYFDSEW